MKQENKNLIYWIIIIVLAILLFKSCQDTNSGGSNSGTNSGGGLSCNTCPPCEDPVRYCCKPTVYSTSGIVAQFSSSVQCEQIGDTTLYNRRCDEPTVPVTTTLCSDIVNPRSQSDCDAGTCTTGICKFSQSTVTYQTYGRCGCG